MSDSWSESPRAFEPNSRSSTSRKSRARESFNFFSAADSLVVRLLTKTSYRFTAQRSSFAYVSGGQFQATNLKPQAQALGVEREASGAIVAGG